MADSLIVNGTEMNVDALKVLAPRANKGGKGKTSRIMAPSGNSLNVSAPLMLTWGVNEYETDTGLKKYSIPLQFPQEQYANENQRRFLQNIKDLEERILTAASENSKEWFNKAKMPREVVEALWTPILKYPKDKETGEPDMTRSPTMKIKIRYWDEKFNVELYDVDRQVLFKPEMQDSIEQTPIDIITKGSHVACVIQCGGIWFAGGKFGVTFNLVQAIVRQPLKIQGACHVPLNTIDRAMIDEANTREEQDDQKEDAAPEQDTAQIVEDDDDDDDEDEPAPEPEPEPEKKKPRKIAKRKKTT